MRKIILVCLSIVALSGCVIHVPASYCTAEGAYAMGVNDAKNGNDMQVNYAKNLCANNQAFINAQYQRGYQFVLANNQNINIHVSHQNKMRHR